MRHCCTITVLCFLAFSAVLQSAEHAGPITAARIRVLQRPSDYTFPGCSCADHRHVKPRTGQISRVEFLLPPELRGTKFIFYHLDPVADDTIWYKVGAVCEFTIPTSAIGKAYSSDHTNSAHTIPYSHYIHDDISEVTNQMETVQQPTQELSPRAAPQSKP